MANIYFLDRIDAVPLQNDKFSYPFNAWLANTVDVVNEINVDVQNFMNGLNIGLLPGSFTQAQIIAMNAAGSIPDSILLYCTDHVPTPVYVGRINGALVQFTTTAFP